MHKDNTYLAIEVLNAADVGIVELKREATEKGVKYLEVPDQTGQGDQHLFLYPLDEKNIDNINEIFDEVGIDLNPDKTLLNLSWLNPEKSTFETNDLIQKVPEIEAFNGNCQLFDLPMVFDFIKEHQDLINKNKVDNLNSTDSFLEEEVFDIPETFDESDKEDEINLNNEEESIPQDELIPESFETQENEQSDENKEYSEIQLESMFDVASEENDEILDPKETNNDDLLLEAAISIFDKKTMDSELPTFDEDTKNLLGSDLVVATAHIDEIRQKGILSIYESLQQSRNRELAQAKNNELAEAQKAHDNNVAQIKRNQEVKIEEIKRNLAQEYDKQKKKAGQTYLEDFYLEYDATHKNELNNLINLDTAPVKKETSEEIKIEDKNLNKYIQEVHKSVFNHITENVDCKEIVDNYKNVVKKEAQRLFAKAKEVNTKNDELQKELDKARTTIAITKETFDAKVSAQVAQKVNAAALPYKKQLEETIEAANTKVIEAQQQTEKEREDKVLLQKKYDSLHEESQKLISQVTELTKQINNRTTDKPLERDPSNFKDTEMSSSHKNRENKKWTKYISYLAIALVSIAFTIIISSLGPFNKSPSANTASVTQKENVASESKQSSKIVPNTFTYTAKNGKKYAVIKDDETSGHYVDDKGVSHTVLFNQK